jgi:hypothetical protein
MFERSRRTKKALPLRRAGMNLVLCFLLMSCGSNAPAGESCDAKSLKLAQVILENIRQKYEAGLVSKWELFEAEVHFAEMRFCMGEIDLKAFCEKSLKEIEEVVRAEMIRAEYERVTPSELARWNKAAARARNQCKDHSE